VTVEAVDSWLSTVYRTCAAGSDSSVSPILSYPSTDWCSAATRTKSLPFRSGRLFSNQRRQEARGPRERHYRAKGMN
jgi:hypothetical protein